MSKEVFKYKTNINCGSCVAKVKPALDDLNGVCNWQVDVTHPSKVLTIETEGISQFEIIEAVQEKGYKIEPLN